MSRAEVRAREAVGVVVTQAAGGWRGQLVPDGVVVCPDCGFELREGRGALNWHRETACDGMVVQCRNFGCEETMVRREREAHEQLTCKVGMRRTHLSERSRGTGEEKVPVPPCRLACGEQVPRSKRELHEANDCARRPVRCPTFGCDEKIEACRLPAHLASDCRAKLKREQLAKAREKAWEVEM
jgi:hypothetical protein